MANIKRNVIHLTVGYDEDKEKAKTKTYYTPPMMSGRLFRSSLEMSKEIDESKDDFENLDKLLNFVAVEVYNNQFTVEELEDGLPPYDLVKELQEQVFFVARGEQSEDTKKFLEKNN